MELPSVVRDIISEYAKPMTRSDWRSLHRMPSLEFYIELAKLFNQDTSKKIYATAICYNSNYRYLIAYYTGKPRISYIYGSSDLGMISIQN